MALIFADVPAGSSLQLDDGSHASVYIQNIGNRHCVIEPGGYTLRAGQIGTFFCVNGTPLTAASDRATTVAYQVSSAASIAAQSGTSVQAKSLVLHLVKDYGADPTGAADATSALDAAMADAVATLSAGTATSVTLFVPGGAVLSLSPATTRFGVILPPNLPGSIELRGPLRGSATIRLSTKCPALVGPDTTNVGVGYTFGKLRISHLTVDANNVNATTTAFAGVVCHFDQQNLNVDGFTLDHVETINVGQPLWTGVVGRRNVNFSSNTLTYNGGTQYSILNIKIRDCRFGVSGGGGNAGVIVQGYYNPATNGTYPGSVALAGGHKTNVYIDNIDIRDSSWASGITSYVGKSTAGAGVGFQVGQDGYGDRVRFKNLSAIGSVDDTYEINSMHDVIVEGCYSEDAPSEGLYIRPGVGGAVDTWRQRIVVRDFTHRHNLICASSMATMPPGLYAHSKDYGVLGGSLVFENINVWANDTNAIWAGGAYVKVVGGFSQLRMRAVRIAMMGWTKTTAVGVRGVEVNLPVGCGNVEIEDVSLRADGTGNTTGGNGVTLSALVLDLAADYQVKVDGVTSRWNVVRSGAGTLTVRDLVIGDINQTDTVDAFAASTTLTGSYRADAGTMTDLAVSGGVLTSAANHTTEKRLTWVRNDTDYIGGQVGPQSDGVVTVKVNQQTTPSTGFKAGVRLKADAATGLNSLHGWLGFDGTNWTINVGTEQAGVVTSRTSTVIGTTITSPAWVRLSQVGSLVTADYLTAVPTTNATLPAATNTASYTLNSTDSTLAPFGPAVQGWAGLVFAPQDATASLDDLRMWHRGTNSLTVDRVSAREVNLSGAGGAVTVNSVAAANTLATYNRIGKRWLLRNCDFSMYANAGVTTSEFSGLSDAASLQLVKRTDNTWVTTPASTSISPTGSPFTYTNQDGYPEDVAIYSGTVSSVTVQRAGQAAAGQVAAATGIVQRLEPGDVLVVTYSSAPTMRKIPVV